MSTGEANLRSLAFIGGCFPPEFAHSYPGRSEAATHFQVNLLRELERCGVEEMGAISLFTVASFPQGPLWFRGRRFHDWDGPYSHVPGFLNVLPVKPLYQALGMWRALATFIRGMQIPPQLLLIYNMDMPVSIPAVLAKRKWQLPLVIILAELPVHRDIETLSLSFGRSMWWKVISSWQKKVLENCDAVISLPLAGIQEFSQSKPTLRLEGGLTREWEDNAAESPTQNTRRVIAFSGGLTVYSGIRELLQAFDFLPGQDIELWITGHGVLAPEVEAAARRDSRIRYLGFLDRSEYRRVLRQATVLVNPRPSYILSHQYSFPSKLLEYLASGRPVISTCAGQVDKDYGEHLFLLREETPEALANLIASVLDRDPAELDNFGARGRQYVLTHKTWSTQGKRAYRFLSQLVAQYGTYLSQVANQHLGEDRRQAPMGTSGLHAYGIED